MAIDRAVRDAVRAGEERLLGVVDRLRAAEAPAAREAGEALEVLSDFGLARLGFGRRRAPEEIASRALGDHDPTPGLTLPEPGASRATYTRSERVSVATLSLVAALALQLISGDRSRHKVVILDEAWFLFASLQGRALLNRLVRLGRAFNATVLRGQPAARGPRRALPAGRRVLPLRPGDQAEARAAGRADRARPCRPGGAGG